ncbi:MAG: hypothetical protein Q7R95_04815, partial [bacterium]|nr:hypothetical protein [bacterium]
NNWLYDYGGRINWITGTQNHIISKKILQNIGQIIGSKTSNLPHQINYVSGGCTMIKKEVFNKIGYFCEDYFLYWGDADFAIKAINNGFKVILDGNTIVHHKYETTYKTFNKTKLVASFIDNAIFIKKNIKWYYKPIAYSALLSKSLIILYNIINFQFHKT